MTAYTLRHGAITDHETGPSWDGEIGRDGKAVLQVKARPKKPPVVTGGERELAMFERVAAHLLPKSKAATADLVMVLAITCEAAINPLTRAVLLKDIPGAEPLAIDPALICTEALDS